jgi:uncharacterized membrane protein
MDMPSEQNNNVMTARIIYFLLLASTIIGITGLIAVIMAYVVREDSPEWLQTHYRFQIRTFWIGLLYTITGLFTLAINIGALILLFTFIWLVVRAAKGLKHLENQQPIQNPDSWMFA